MTTDQNGLTYVYDAWNRLVAVKNSSGTTLETYSYDGMGDRISNTVGSTTTDYYNSDKGQVLENKAFGVFFGVSKPASGAEGYRFNSCRAYQKNKALRNGTQITCTKLP